MNEDGMLEQPFEDDMRYEAVQAEELDSDRERYEAEDDLHNWETGQVYHDQRLDREAENYATANSYDLADRAADWVEDYEPRLTCTFADYRYDDNGEWCGAEASEPDAETLGWKQGEDYCYCPDHAWEVLGIPRKESTND